MNTEQPAILIGMGINLSGISYILKSKEYELITDKKIQLVYKLATIKPTNEYEYYFALH